MNYPTIKRINFHPQKMSYANRGMTLEEDINETNRYYLEKNKAVVYKKPTPIQVVEQQKEIITKAFFKEPSTTDYNGVYQGKYLDFEAKETTISTRFPLSNIHSHQIKHLKNVVNRQGIAFLIIRFTKLDKTYLLFGKDFLEFLQDTTRKSIPITYFEEKAYLIPPKISPRVDYLEIIEKYGGNYE